ncbi:ABC transporter substrate-binding protein [Dactylosporangium maewongense]|uniref:ABC transporter substrate-binding protein n=1 Tax=Dactylosporangium maewongense TaxID=634393 RepID=A0ABP4PD52_9ACTN
MRLRSPVLAALTTGAMLFTTACGGSAGSSEPASPSAPGPSALRTGLVTVTFWHGIGGAPGEALQAEIDKFNAANTGRIAVKVAFQGSYTSALAKYTSAIRDKSTPSIMVSNDITTGFIHDAGQTVPAQAMAAANPADLDLNKLRPAARNYYTAKGELLAVPLATSMPLLYVNDAILAQAGVDRSTLRTLDGVAAAARAINAAVPGVKGIVQPFDGWWFEQLTAAAGVAYCTPANGREPGGATAAALTSDAQRKAFGTMAKLYTDGVGLDVGTDGANGVKAFTTGKVAMMFNSSGSIGNLQKAGMQGYSTLPYPISGDRATSGALIGGAAMWVSRVGHSDAEQVASWKVISYLASAPVQERFSQASGYAPVNTDVDTSATEQAFLAREPNYATLSKQFAETPATPATAGCLSGAMPGIRTEVVAQMQKAFAGTITIDAALAAAETAATAKIQDYRRQAGL